MMRNRKRKLVPYKNTKGVLSNEEYIHLFLPEVSGNPVQETHQEKPCLKWSADSTLQVTLPFHFSWQVQLDMRLSPTL